MPLLVLRLPKIEFWSISCRILSINPKVAVSVKGCLCNPYWLPKSSHGKLHPWRVTNGLVFEIHKRKDTYIYIYLYIYMLIVIFAQWLVGWHNLAAIFHFRCRNCRNWIFFVETSTFHIHRKTKLSLYLACVCPIGLHSNRNKQNLFNWWRTYAKSRRNYFACTGLVVNDRVVIDR